MPSTRCKLAVVAGVGVAVVVVVLVVVLTMDPAAGQPWSTETRLPDSVLPRRYDLLLNPNLVDGSFTGTVNIDIELKEDRKYFVIHGKYLNVSNVQLVSSTSTIALKETFEVPKNEWWVIQPVHDPIPKGNYVLKMEFGGLLTRGIVGFYRSTYNSANNEKRYIATSKFEPTYARLAFPCFDEPAMKATYKVRLVKPSSSDYLALSNSDVKSNSTDPNTNLTTVEFTETVKMSSYLAVFIVCDFEKDSKNYKMLSGKPVNVYARKDQIKYAQEALDVAVEVVDFYAQYFDVPYPMPKIDLIAIPDFVSGAMENWGLITFRETSILFDPNENSPANQESISETVAHELAHMWFGNLVTMKWWTDLWLNEGFATFMAQKGVNKKHPDWQYLDQFVVGTLLSILKLDAELSSHPVLQEVSSPDQITEIFDTISYDKGSSVILMLETFMGEENFAKGLHTYLNTHLYGNAETADLWKALQDYAPNNVDVAKVMDTWTRQMGFPLVTVSKIESGKYSLSQKRFLSNKDAKYDPNESKYGYKWEIPIFYSTASSKNNSLIWLSKDTDKVEISTKNPSEWIKLNHNQRCYYRVMYHEEGWQEFIKELSKDLNQFDEIDRAGLISDAFSLADADILKYETALDLTKYLCREKKFIPWSEASTNLGSLIQRLPESTALKAYGIKLVEPIVKDLTWTVGDDPHLERRLRATVLNLACSLKEPKALDAAKQLFYTWLNGGEKPHPDIRSVVYKYGLGNSEDETEWNILYDKFKSETNTQERLKLMYALATTPNEMLLKRFLNDAKNESIIRSQDYFTVLGYISENPKGTQLVWDFYRDNYDYLVTRFSLNDRVFGRFITKIAAKFDSEERLKELQEFFAKNSDAGAGAAARKQALEGVENRISWLKKHKETVETWLENNSNVC